MAKCGRLFAAAAAMVALLTAEAALSPPAAAADQGGPVVQTTEGPVQGLVRNGMGTFLGIPYAAPPAGALRWQPPRRARRGHRRYVPPSSRTPVRRSPSLACSPAQ